MTKLAEYVEKSMGVSRDALLGELPGACLLSLVVTDGDFGTAWKTGTYRIDAGGLTPEVRGGTLRPALPSSALDPTRVDVWALAKSTRNPHKDRIYVGRAPNNDIVLESPGVSKSHAFFRLGEQGWTLTDAGSSNGTKVGSAALKPHVEQPISGNAIIGFSPSASLCFVLMTDLYPVLGELAKLKAR